MAKHLLIVDDNVEVCKSLLYNFQRYDYTIAYALNATEALTSFMRQAADAVILDLRLGTENGLDLLREFVRRNPRLPVIILTGYATIQTAVEAIKLGAYDFVEKPVNFQHLRHVVAQAIQCAGQPFAASGQRIETPPDMPPMITQNPAMLAVYVKAQKLANSTIPILILGESGTGKELLAEFIHHHSPRRQREIIKINCSAFPETLIDNELFGHEKGAFTGANSSFQGVFERAHQSTLFLDEIAEMPLPTQAKILRALHNQEIRRIGGKQVITVDTRLIAATNHDLAVLLQAHTFREDLYYRLNAAMLTLPPLRERQEDLLGLTECFLQDVARQNRTPVKLLSEAVIEMFLQYDWPGNVRELKNTVQYAATIAPQAAIQPEDLPAAFLAAPLANAQTKVIDVVEKNLILATLKKTAHNKKKTAELLNMSRRTLYNKLEKYGIRDTE